VLFSRGGGSTSKNLSGAITNNEKEELSAEDFEIIEEKD
jgi:hypothetical protein